MNIVLNILLMNYDKQFYKCGAGAMRYPLQMQLVIKLCNKRSTNARFYSKFSINQLPFLLDSFLTS